MVLVIVLDEGGGEDSVDRERWVRYEERMRGRRMRV
jgi:hypothetical protein